MDNNHRGRKKQVQLNHKTFKKNFFLYIFRVTTCYEKYNNNRRHKQEKLAAIQRQREPASMITFSWSGGVVVAVKSQEKIPFVFVVFTSTS